MPADQCPAPEPRWIYAPWTGGRRPTPGNLTIPWNPERAAKPVDDAYLQRFSGAGHYDSDPWRGSSYLARQAFSVVVLPTS